ncbi:MULTISPECIES: hypothetical protein [Photorhabdus]|uniref:hypothetical protein n=1 Tax=Photorhabdus TaxID=29487 RepID=UPI0007B4F4A7|nr:MULTISPECIES: hypothetical protein [Photorhabdus]NDL49934.1 hypothetical protein [Photorhabdus laumondii subsp. laumondii]
MILNIYVHTLWISRCIAAARERIPGSIENYVTGVSECSQQRGNLKDDGYSENRFTIENISIHSQLLTMIGDQPSIFSPD